MVKFNIIFIGENMQINVERKNKKYASLLKEIYNGKSSDLSTFLLFKYEYIYFFKVDNSFSTNMNKLANDSLLHVEIIGKLITLLGDNPKLEVNNHINQFFVNDIRLLLEINIRLTKEKIILYSNCLNKINDIYIKEILEKFIIEERKNLKILEILQLKNKVKNNNLDLN